MPEIVLRPYQSAAVSECIDRLSRQSVVLCAPTGSGKTAMGVAVVRQMGVRCLWVAHRRELIHQALRAVRAAGGVAGTILAGERPVPDAPVQIASVQTLARRELPDADLLVIDEAHHARGDSYAKLVARYPRRLGLTATPFRLDGKGLGAVGFDSLLVAAYPDDLCADGTLHAPLVYAAKGPDLSGVKITAGEFNQHDLAVLTNQTVLVGNVVETWQKRASGRRTVVFAVDIAHGEALLARFREARIPAEMVTGKTPKAERDATLGRLHAGTTLVVVNCMVMTEGVDVPPLEVAVVARPTASLGLHLQMLGRIMRCCEGKDGAIVLDHAGNYERHGLVTERLHYSLTDRVKKKPSEASRTRACPECGRVCLWSAGACPSCGHVFRREEDRPLPTETDGELVPVGHGDDFAARSLRWHSMKVAGIRIVRARAADAWFTEREDKQAYGIACAKYKERYGCFPLTLKDGGSGEVLVDATKATPDVWDRLRNKWYSIGVEKGWSHERASSFSKWCESEARAHADREAQKNARIAAQAALLVAPKVVAAPATAKNGAVSPRTLPAAMRPGNVKCAATWDVPGAQPTRCGAVPEAGARFCVGHTALLAAGEPVGQPIARGVSRSASKNASREDRHAAHVASGHCRWRHGKGGSQFCGNRNEDGSDVCKAHRLMLANGAAEGSDTVYYECDVHFPRHDGDSDFFCHKAVVVGTRYCEEHATVESRRALHVLAAS